jgi:hypothetical protein
MRTILFAALMVAASWASAEPADQVDDPNTMPTDGLALYPGFRDALVRRGWHPLPSEYAYEDGFPEVSCGNALCSADWRRPDGRVGSFTLWPEYDSEDRLLLIIAPAFDE